MHLWFWIPKNMHVEKRWENNTRPPTNSLLFLQNQCVKVFGVIIADGCLLSRAGKNTRHRSAAAPGEPLTVITPLKRSLMMSQPEASWLDPWTSWVSREKVDFSPSVLIIHLMPGADGDSWGFTKCSRSTVLSTFRASPDMLDLGLKKCLKTIYVSINIRLNIRKQDI